MFSRSFRFLLPGLTVLCFVLLVIGCGGGGGGVGGESFSLRSVHGRVRLPQGSKLSLTTLQVVSAYETSPVASDGTFTVLEPSGSPAIVYLTDASGKIVLLGYSATAGGPGDVSAQTTAQVLLFYALGAQTLPPDQYAQALTLIAADNASTALAATLSSRVAANPTAISDGDPALDNAVSAAATAILPAGGRASDRDASSAKAMARTNVVVARSGRAGGFGQLIIQPSGLQSGVEILQNPNGTGIVASNNFRRHCQFFVFKTGTKDQNGNVTNFPLVQPVGGAHDLPSVVKINGVFGTLVDLINGKVAYAPKTSDPVDLPLDPGTSETHYEVVVVGFSTRFDVPGVFTDPRYVNQIAGLQSAYDDLALDAFVRDFVLNILATAVFAPNDIKSVLQDPSAVSSLTIDLTKLVKSAPGVVDSLKAGKPLDAWNAFVVAVANSSGLRKLIANSLSKLPTVVSLGKNIVNGDQILEKLLNANTILKGFELALTAGDIGKLLHDWNASRAAEVWSVNVIQPRVRLDPQNSSVTVNNNIVQLTASVVGVQGPALRFVWSTTGKQGHLENANNSVPLPTGPIPDSQADYVADLLKLQNGQSDTVTVQAFLASDLNTPIGTAVATITVGQTLNCSKPPPPLLQYLPNVPPGGPGTFTVTLDKTDYHAGDIMTATLRIVAGNTDEFAWDIDIQVGGTEATGNRLPATLLTIDGKSFGGSNADTGAQDLLHPGQAETHVLTFRIGTPVDPNGDATTACGLGSVNGLFQGPLISAQIFSHNSQQQNVTVFFNAGP